MTNKEAIEILKEIIEEGWLISDMEKCKAIDACELAIKALEQTEWIPVTERLPEENGTYKITLQTGDGYRYVAEDYFFTERNFFESEAYYKGVGRKIVAWQPIIMPSPYEGKKND